MSSEKEHAPQQEVRRSKGAELTMVYQVAVSMLRKREAGRISAALLDRKIYADSAAG